MTLFRKTDTFNIFQQCVSDYSHGTVLDFGGNRGNLLTSSNGKIKKYNYTCLDISKSAIDALPDNVKSIHWNRYHSYYNPTGNVSEPFPKLKYYDIIFANSVFTHHKLEEMLYCIDCLSHYTNRIVFTYIDPNNSIFIEKFCKKYYDLKIGAGDVSYTVDKNNILWSAFDTNYLKTYLPYQRVTAGTTDWFNYMDIQIQHSIVPGIFGY